jgi:serine/threonine-protein kinase RsbW
LGRPPADPASATSQDGSSLQIAAVPAVVASVTSLRQTLTEWARASRPYPEQIVEVRTATYEALANVVQHAYRPDHTGVLDLDAVCTRRRTR